MSAKKAPSTSASISAGSGVGSLIEMAAAMLGHPLPPGAGTVLGGMVAGAAHWFQKKRAAAK